ncbi:hypothetical protein HK104_002187 [Borealophlyctis nickersoniae]|nr:hypothetical protein HK104_002187 [Borealophlyctis nickersoniae]
MDPPLEHWPNIISIMQSHDRLLSPPVRAEADLNRRRLSQSSIRAIGAGVKKYATISGAMALAQGAFGGQSMGSHTGLAEIVQFYDRKVNTTYLLAKVEPRVVVVIIFCDRQVSAESSGALEYVQRLSSLLNHAEVLRSR